MKKVFIDGSAGTTGLRIYERLAAREDISLLTLSEEKRKDTASRAEMLNSADAIYLLRHMIMPSLYPIAQSGDVNGDGVVNSADAIYLLRHIIMPGLYPLE